MYDQPNAQTSKAEQQPEFTLIYTRLQEARMHLSQLITGFEKIGNRFEDTGNPDPSNPKLGPTPVNGIVSDLRNEVTYFERQNEYLRDILSKFEKLI